jgi:hypothetical protein
MQADKTLYVKTFFSTFLPRLHAGRRRGTSAYLIRAVCWWTRAWANILKRTRKRHLFLVLGCSCVYGRLVLVLTLAWLYGGEQYRSSLWTTVTRSHWDWVWYRTVGALPSA